jgi:hypothetical protein
VAYCGLAMKKLIFLCLPLLATAGPIFTWSFDQPTGVVDPTVSILMHASITNTSGISETIYWGSGAVGTGSFYGIYQINFDFNSLNSLTALGATPFAPGETRGFTLGTLTPVSPPVAPGVYALASAALTFCTDNTYVDCTVLQSSSNGFQRTVSAVPEPSSIGFLGAGLVFLRWWKRSRPLA